MTYLSSNGISRLTSAATVDSEVDEDTFWLMIWFILSVRSWMLSSRIPIPSFDIMLRAVVELFVVLGCVELFKVISLICFLFSRTFSLMSLKVVEIVLMSFVMLSCFVVMSVDIDCTLFSTDFKSSVSCSCLVVTCCNCDSTESTLDSTTCWLFTSVCTVVDILFIFS